MKKKPDRKWLAALALVVGAACAAASPIPKKADGTYSSVIFARGE